MKNPTTKTLAVFSLILIIIGLVISKITTDSFVSIGLEDIRHTCDLSGLNIVVDYIWGQNNDDEAIDNDLAENIDQYLIDLSEAESVFVVKPTGLFTQYRGSYSQSAEVIEIVHSSSSFINIGDLITIYQSGGFSLWEDQVHFSQASNVLYPDQLYVVFLNESDLNNKSGNMDFYFYQSSFSCVKLTNRVLQKPFSDFVGSTETVQFCTTDKVLAAFVNVEEAIINQYKLYVYENEYNN